MERKKANIGPPEASGVSFAQELKRAPGGRMARALRKGFTLIELLIVVAILGILVTVVLATVLYATSRGDVEKARNFMNQVIPAAMSAWQGEFGYPTNEFPRSPNLREGEYFDGNAELYEELMKKPRAALVATDHFTEGNWNGRPVFLDPWGRPYIYRNYTQRRSATGPAPEPYRGRRFNDNWDLISMGPDGVLGTEDDVVRGGTE
jgi:general secretion pathway protein G